ncbi:branched-chain amino acid ABC transporter permease [Haloglomus litoreum]|uniref:branched-chain amino acid ABC transporter permease n=1 Tax=Haloglomus litoreum TaxID=3034026 RepID=UPI0023E78DD7|nr:branched-chain amino acid ABC transporter permease [Haloglomus sp. DT116]
MSTENESIIGNSTGAERRQAVLEKLNPITMPLRYQIGLLGLLLFVLLPTTRYPDQMGGPTTLIFLAIFGMSWDVVSGYTGQLSFGHAFFIALGGYTSAILDIQHGITPVVGIPVGMIVAGIGGVLVGLPALRLRGPYLSLVTLIVPIILSKLFTLFNNSFTPLGIPIAPDGLGGRNGPGLPTQLFGIDGSGSVVELASGYSGIQQTALANYYFALGLMVVVLMVLIGVTRSSAGSVFTAIREDEDAVAAAGLDGSKFKLFAFVLSALVAGLGGAIWVHTIKTPTPLGILGQDDIQQSINLIIISILGGTGTIVGPIVGAVVYAATGIVIGVIDPLIGFDLANLRPLPLLAAAMAVLVFAPGGILRASIRGGRMVLASARGEEYEGESVGGDGDSALGQIIEKYRAELRDIIDERR